jgi:hypothetical protein
VPTGKLVSVAVVAALAGVLLAAVVSGAQGSDRQGTGLPTTGIPTTTTTNVPDRRVGCTLTFKKQQPVGTIKLTVKCEEVARVTAGGTLTVRSKKLKGGREALKARSFKLKSTSVAFGPGQTKTVNLKLSKAARKAAKKAVAGGGAAKAKITVGFEDLLGNSSAKKVGVSLRKKR